MEKGPKGNVESRQPAGEMVFGTRPVMEALLAGREVDKLLIQKDLDNELTKELLQTAKQHHVPVQRVPLEKLHKITRKNHQGAIAFLSAITFASLDNVMDEAYRRGEDPFLLMLDRVTDVRNLGAIARSAECAGVNGLIVPARNSARLGSDAVKTSAGALHHLPLIREDYLVRTCRYLKNNGLAIVGITEKTENNLFESDLRGPVVLIAGSEEDGISPELLAETTHKVSIPMHGQIASLNVSVATGIALFEVLRQRSK